MKIANFRYSKKTVLLLCLTFGSLMSVSQSFLIVALSQYLFGITNPAIITILSIVALCFCAISASAVGLMQIDLNAILIGAIMGAIIHWMLMTPPSIQSMPTYNFLLPLTVSLLTTYLIALFSFKKIGPKILNPRNLLIAAHILCDIILLTSLFASIWLPWTRPFVVAQAGAVLLGWYVLRACPYTIDELKLISNTEKKHLTSQSFLIRYARTWFGLIMTHKTEGIIDGIFYALTAIAFLSWFI